MQPCESLSNTVLLRAVPGSISIGFCSDFAMDVPGHPSCRKHHFHWQEPPVESMNVKPEKQRALLPHFVLTNLYLQESMAMAAETDSRPSHLVDT